MAAFKNQNIRRVALNRTRINGKAELLTKKKRKFEIYLETGSTEG